MLRSGIPWVLSIQVVDGIEYFIVKNKDGKIQKPYGYEKVKLDLTEDELKDLRLRDECSQC